MTRLTCGFLLLETCRQGCIPVNILDYLQIPQFRLVAQTRLGRARQTPAPQTSRHRLRHEEQTEGNIGYISHLGENKLT